MLKQRIITAILLVTVFLTSLIYANQLWISGLFGLMFFVASLELIEINLKPAPWKKYTAAILFVGAFFYSLSFIDAQLIYWQTLIGAGLWIGIILYLPFYRFNGNLNLATRVPLTLLGLFLVWVSSHGLVYLQFSIVNGIWVLLYMLSLVWIADIGAYFSGRKFGKHKLAPTISPGKTWEGVYGGIFANLIWMSIIYYYTDGWGMSILQFTLITALTSFISVVGDLFESLLKREAKVKDSGKCLPGHGGVLDRIDGVLAAVPIFITGLFLVGLL